MPDSPFSSTAPLFWLTPQWVQSRMLDRFEVVEAEETKAEEVRSETCPDEGESGFHTSV